MLRYEAHHTTAITVIDVPPIVGTSYVSFFIIVQSCNRVMCLLSSAHPMYCFYNVLFFIRPYRHAILLHIRRPTVLDKYPFRHNDENWNNANRQPVLPNRV